MTVTTIVVSFSRHQLLTFKLSSERDTTVTTAYADTASSMTTHMLTRARSDIMRQLKQDKIVYKIPVHICVAIHKSCIRYHDNYVGRCSEHQQLSIMQSKY